MICIIMSVIFFIVGGTRSNDIQMFGCFIVSALFAIASVLYFGLKGDDDDDDNGWYFYDE